jgi:hypothetical protein
MMHPWLLALVVPQLAAAAAAAQGDASAVFVVRLRSDTIAVERATISGRRAESAMRLHTPPALVRQVVVLGAAGGAERVSTTVGPGGKGVRAL